MITNVRNIDVIVTATVMDCLPKTTKNVLIDHISFAPLQLEHKVNSIYNLSYSVNQSFNSKDEVVANFQLIWHSYHFLMLCSRPLSQFPR